MLVLLLLFQPLWLKIAIYSYPPNAAYERRWWVIMVLDDGLSLVQHQAIV